MAEYNTNKLTAKQQKKENDARWKKYGPQKAYDAAVNNNPKVINRTPLSNGMVLEELSTTGTNGRKNHSKPRKNETFEYNTRTPRQQKKEDDARWKKEDRVTDTSRNNPSHGGQNNAKFSKKNHPSEYYNRKNDDDLISTTAVCPDNQNNDEYKAEPEESYDNNTPPQNIFDKIKKYLLGKIPGKRTRGTQPKTPNDKARVTSMSKVLLKKMMNTITATGRKAITPGKYAYTSAKNLQHMLRRTKR